MSKTIDARGLSCPQPVLMTLDEIRTGETNELEILVDTDTSKENVIRAARSQEWTVSNLSEDGECYKIEIKKE